MLIYGREFFKIACFYTRLPMLYILFFGFLNGYFLQIPWVTVNYWLSTKNVPIEYIGLFSLASIPYAIKYIVAPLIDRYNPLSKLVANYYKSWSIISLFFLSIGLCALSGVDIEKDLLLLGVICTIIALFASIMDIALNILRINMTEEKSVGQASTVYTIGYRLGLLTTGAGIIFLSYYINWNKIFIGTSISAIFFLIVIFIIKIPDTHHIITYQNDYKENFLYRIFIEPFHHLGTISNFIYILLFLLFYKISDYMLIVMLQPLLVKLQYNALEISTAGKFFGIACAIIGGLFAGIIMSITSIKKSLMFFGIMHMLSYFTLFPLYFLGHNIKLLYLFTACQATTSGMTMTAYIAFISLLCKGKYKGTQYAVFFSIMGFSRTIFPTFSGYLVVMIGWQYFFFTIILLSCVSLILLPKIKSRE